MKIVLNEQDINRLMAMLGEVPYKNVNPIVTFLETKIVQPEPEPKKNKLWNKPL